MDVVRPSPHRITRKSLLQVAELVIKSQIESSVHRIPDDSSPDVQNFLAVLENLFYHGLKSHNFLVGKNVPKHPWCLILQLSNLPSFSHTSSVKLLDHLKSNFSKLRAWIKLSLVRCCLHSAMLDLVQLKPNLTKYYSRDAIFRSEEIFNLIDSLVGLENVQFNLDFKTELVDYSYCVPPIDFSPFLLFKQSLETQLSAICECQNENTEDRKSKCMWRHGFEKLKQNQVYSLEQLQYHEELIQKQFTQLNKYKEQLDCYKETTASLESYILELQVKLTLIHEQYDQELKRLGVNQSRLTAPTFRNIPNRFQQIHDINEKPSKISSFLNPSIKLIHNAACASASTSYQMPSILSVDQGVDALSLEDSSNPDVDSNNNHSTSTSIVEHIPSESKRYRSVKFTESNSNIKKIDQDSCVLPVDISNRKSNTKRLPLPIRARSNSPTTTTTTNSSSYPSSISESSQQKYIKSKSPLKSNSSGQTFHQKSKMLVSVQEIPSERFILPDNSYSTVSFPNNSSPKTLDSMTVVVKPRSHSLFSCYVPKISTNEVEGIIRHVDSLMNPQTTMKNDTVNTITTPTTDTTVNDKDGIVIDDHLLECKNQCSNLVLFEAGLIDSITSSEIMETSSEYNPSDRLHSSSIREYYHLTSEEDLGNSDEEDVDDDSEKNNDSDNKTSAIRQQQEEHEETI
uniref:RUN domain-containing protein n=2 Tax=Schistosoma mansoni TaxID=6183 RepID=A0A3Q0KP44_SCHMA